MSVGAVKMSQWGFCSIMLCLGLLWCVNEQMGHEDNRTPQKLHRSRVIRPLCHLYRDTWEEKNDRHEENKVTGTQPLWRKLSVRICHCQVFQPKWTQDLFDNTNKQLKHTPALKTWKRIFLILLKTSWIMWHTFFSWQLLFPDVAFALFPAILSQAWKWTNNHRKLGEKLWTLSCWIIVKLTCIRM